jgi:O-antigen ligase
MLKPAAARSAIAAPLQTLALLLPPVAALIPKLVVVLLAGAALWAVIAAYRGGWRPRPDPGLTILAGVLWGWALVTCLWTLSPWDGLVMWLRDGALIAAGLLLLDVLRRDPGPDADTVARWLALGMLAAAAVVGVELMSGHALMRAATGTPPEAVPHGDSRLNRGATTLVLLLPLLLYGLTRRTAGAATIRVRALGLAIAAAAALAALATPSATAGVALAVAVAVGAVAGLPGRIAKPLLAAGAALALLTVAAMPQIAGGLGAAPASWRERLPESAVHRLHIWSFTAERIADRPWAGWGFNSAEAMPNFGVAPFYPDQTRVIPLHPHNGALQVRLDLGVPGLGMTLGFLGVLLWRAGQGPPAVRAARSAALAGAITVAFLGYGLWQEQWIATLAALGVLTATVTGRHRDRPPLGQDRSQWTHCQRESCPDCNK